MRCNRNGRHRIGPVIRSNQTYCTTVRVSQFLAPEPGSDPWRRLVGSGERHQRRRCLACPPDSPLCQRLPQLLSKKLSPSCSPALAPPSPPLWNSWPSPRRRSRRLPLILLFSYSYHIHMRALILVISALAVT